MKNKLLVSVLPFLFNLSPAPALADATAPERAQVEAVLHDYFRGYLTADRELVARAFHPDTRLFSVEDDGKLDTTAMPEWLSGLDARKLKGDIRTAERKIASIDVTASAAVAKVVLTFPKYEFTDYLSLLKIEGRWRIIGKIYAYRELR